MPKKPSAADIKSQYGFVAQLANSFPAIRNVLNRAIREKWTPQRFSMAIAETPFWKNTPANTREWIIQKIADPATARQDMLDGAREIRSRAELLGIPHPSFAAARNMWLHSRVRGLEGAELDSYIFQKRTQPKSNIEAVTTWGGRYGELANEMLNAAYNYGYAKTGKVDNRLAGEVAVAVRDVMNAGGGGNTEEWMQRMRNFAAAKYQPFADRIRGGETVMDIARPYMQTVSELLELPESAVGLDERLIDRALQGQPTEKGKPPEAMAVWQVEQAARKDERWRTTNNAREQVGTLATELGKMFGKVAN